MIETSEKYKRMINGERDTFSTKEILVEFMLDQKKSNEYLLSQIVGIRSSLSSHETSLRYMKWTIGLMISAMAFIFISII